MVWPFVCGGGGEGFNVCVGTGFTYLYTRAYDGPLNLFFSVAPPTWALKGVLLSNFIK